MANRPSSYINWVPSGDPSKVIKPPTTQSDLGWAAGEPCPAQFLNYLFYQIDSWCQYLDQAAALALSAPALLASARIVNSGVWTFAAASGSITWSSAFNIAVPGIPDSANAIAAGSLTLADGQCLYANLNLPTSILATSTAGNAILTNVATLQGVSVGLLVSGPGVPAGTSVQFASGASVTLTAAVTSSQSQQPFNFYAAPVVALQVTTAATLVPGRTTVLLARRFGNVVIVGLNTAEAVLRDGESKTIRNGGYGYLSSAVAGVALADRTPVYVSSGSDGRTQGSIYPCEAGIANGWPRSQFLGFTLGAAASGATVPVVCGGQMGGFSGLTQGAAYYVDPAAPGAITTAKTSISGQILVMVGVAITATQMMVSPPALNATQRPTTQDWSGALTMASIGATAGSSNVLKLAAGHSLVPVTDASSDLGAATTRINNVYTANLHATSGNVYSQQSSFALANTTITGTPQTYFFQTAYQPSGTVLAQRAHPTFAAGSLRGFSVCLNYGNINRSIITASVFWKLNEGGGNQVLGSQIMSISTNTYFSGLLPEGQYAYLAGDRLYFGIILSSTPYANQPLLADVTMLLSA